MKTGKFIKANSKGQIVIPTSIRDELNIDSSTTLNIMVSGNCILISPLEDFIIKIEEENSYFNLLKKTKGSWSENNCNGIKIDN